MESTVLDRLLSDPYALVVEYIGKGAAKLWVNKELRCFEAHQSFLLALKYYLKREPSANVQEELTGLITNEFEPLIDWADQGHTTPARRNIGMAYCCLEKWDKCIKCLESGIPPGEDSCEVLRYLAIAYTVRSDYDSAIKTFWKVIDKEYSNEFWFIRDFYRCMRDNAISTALSSSFNPILICILPIQNPRSVSDTYIARRKSMIK